VSRGEFEVVERLRRELQTSDPRVVIGIGDDAAVLDVGSGRVVWTIDEAVEGTHFRRGLLSAAELGYKATMSAASDLAAMGARPTAMLSALVLTSADETALSELVAGQRKASQELGAPIVGGNLARGERMCISTTWLGTPERVVSRAGARPGDQVWLAGPVGLAAAGLAWLEREESADAPGWRSAPRAPAQGSTHIEPAIRAWQSPVALIEEGAAAASVATAMIDVSDGLAQDAGHIAKASGARLVLRAEALMGSLLRAAAKELSRDPLTLALRGGEDYALVACAPAGEVLPGFTLIGQCELSSSAASSCWSSFGRPSSVRS